MKVSLARPINNGAVSPTNPNIVYHTAGTDLSGHRAVVVDAAAVFYADKDNIAHLANVIGITLGAASSGATATIQTGEEIIEPSWNWTMDQPIFLGNNGMLTQTAPTTGFALVLGFPVTSQIMFVRIGTPIILA